jgi:histidinol-phosphate aminotransferase
MNYFEKYAAMGIQALQPYQSGKPENELKRELGLDHIIKLASNENPHGPDPRIIAELPAYFAKLSRYPDGNGFDLKQVLATRFSVKPEQIILGNGSNDILELIARVFLQSGRQAVMSRHAFAIYYLATQAVGGQSLLAETTDGNNGSLFGHDLQAMRQLISDKTAVVFIANPNNPTGTYLPAAEIKIFVESLPEHIICVIDEAYFEYVEADDYSSALSLLDEHPNILITRTFSKAYGLAGLRIGYSISNPDIADLLNRVRQPFNVNALALAAAQIALTDDAFLTKSKALNSQGLHQLAQGLQALGLSFIPSVGNFICCDLARPALSVYQALLEQGVIVRPVENYQLPGYIRITAGTESEIQFFLTALKTIIDS